MCQLSGSESHESYQCQAGSCYTSFRGASSCYTSIRKVPHVICWEYGKYDQRWLQDTIKATNMNLYENLSDQVARSLTSHTNAKPDPAIPVFEVPGPAIPVTEKCRLTFVGACEIYDQKAAARYDQSNTHE